ncbi:MAG: sugar ABC transporter permease [Ruminococcus sp.]|nr:sugar ABC transporter permease [Ruminococcus sp.]
MKYTEYMALSPMQRFWYNFKKFITSIPSGLGNFFAAIGRGILGFFKGIGKAAAEYAKGFVKGDIFTKISYLVMGCGNICRGQILKGLMFLAMEVGYIFFMVFFGADYIQMFITLHAVRGADVTKNLPGGKSYTVPGEIEVYSYQILLFGILALLVTVAFIAMYFVSVKSARKVDEMVKNGERVPKFRDELKDLLDSRFHATLLTTPIILIAVFVLLPLLFMIIMAFTGFSGAEKSYVDFGWVGFQNFAEIFKTSETGTSMGSTFAKITGWTLIWAVAATFSNYILGMVVALMINKKGIKLKKLWRTMFVMTIAVPQFVTLLLMAQILGPYDYSPMNVILSQLFGVAEPIDFLGSTVNNGLLPRIMVIVVNCWVGIPYTILMTSGILMNIPEDLYESARIDGAGPVKSFMKITLPYMLFVTTPYLITTFIGNVNNFNVIFLLTNGGPVNNLKYRKGMGHTDLLITLLYKLSINDKLYGLGAAIGIMVFLVCATLSLVTFNMTKSAKNEEEFS